MMRLGIALSGGGARGMMHIGVLQALEENDIVPEIVSGTSAGAIVGALYAHGFAPAEIKEIAGEQNVLLMFALKIPDAGFIRHTALRKLLVKHLPENSFNQAVKPLHIAVSNLNSGQAEVYSEGPLIDLIIASSSVPILFEPATINNSKYVDGGVLMNLPASPIRELCDVLIGVNLVPLTSLENTDLKTVISIGTRCFDLAALNNIRPQMEHCDILIEAAEISKISRFSFKQRERMYEIGYAVGLRSVEEIKRHLRDADQGR